MHILDELVGQIVTIFLIGRDNDERVLEDACVTDVDDGWLAYEIDGHMFYTQLSKVETIRVEGTIN
jgi:hypothetical protein